MGGPMADALREHGGLVVFAVTLLSCLGLPIPAAVVLFAAGVFVAAEPAGLLPVFLLAYLAAALGGATLFGLGRLAGTRVLDALGRRPALAGLIARAEALVARRGRMAVFLGSSVVAQVGPAVHLISGAAGLGWRAFLAAQLSGRLIWVAGYMALGVALSDRVIGAVTG